MPSRSRNITVCAVMTAAGLIIGYIESLMVIPVNLPGIRIGLANISTLITLYLCGPVYALSVHLLRILMSSVLFGTGVTLMYSLCGGIFAFTAMIVLKRFDFGIYGVSVGGAVFHNLAQIGVAALLIGNQYVFAYIPALTIAGCIFGVLTGILSNIIINRLKKILVSEREGIK